MISYNIIRHARIYTNCCIYVIIYNRIYIYNRTYNIYILIRIYSATMTCTVFEQLWVLGSRHAHMLSSAAIFGHTSKGPKAC